MEHDSQDNQAELVRGRIGQGGLGAVGGYHVSPQAGCPDFLHDPASQVPPSPCSGGWEMTCEHDWAGAAICELCNAHRCLDCERIQRVKEHFTGGRCGLCHREHLAYLSREDRWKALDSPREVESKKGPNAELRRMDELSMRVSQLVAAGEIEGFQALEYQRRIDKKIQKLKGLRFAISQGIREKEKGQDDMPQQPKGIGPEMRTFQGDMRILGAVARTARPASVGMFKKDYRGARV